MKTMCLQNCTRYGVKVWLMIHHVGNLKNGFHFAVSLLPMFSCSCHLKDLWYLPRKKTTPKTKVRFEENEFSPQRCEVHDMMPLVALA